MCSVVVSVIELPGLPDAAALWTVTATPPSVGVMVKLPASAHVESLVTGSVRLSRMWVASTTVMLDTVVAPGFS